MKNIRFLIIFLLVLSEINPKFLRFLQQKSSTNSFDYSDYSAISTNENLSSRALESKTKDESVVYITKSGITITNSNIQKTSGDSSNTENSEFYGVNSAILVQGGEATITGGTITTSAKGANAIVATNKGIVNITGTKITSTSSGSARGLHSTYGGKIYASNVEISTKGGSCATLATDRGEGIVSCKECKLTTEGAGSPLIYSTGDISISKSTGTATGAQMVVVEGKNTASILENSELKCNGIGNRNNVDRCGVMLYQSMSGDAASGTSIFNCNNSKMEILSSSSVYSSAPMFFITNTNSIINLEGCSFSFGSKIFMNVQGTSEWGKAGANGGVVTLNLKNQNIEGDFVVDTYSGVTINLVNSQIKGTFNTAKSGAKLAICLDKDSSITLTGDSYYTSLTNEDSSGINIIYGSYTFTKYDEKDISQNSGNQGQNQGNNPPNGNPPNRSDMPSNGNPPNRSDMPPNGNSPNRSDMPPNGNPPSGSNMPLNDNPPNGSDMPQNGNPPSGSNMPPNGNPPNGNSPNGNPSNDNPPNGSNMPQNDNPPNGSNMPQNGNLSNGNQLNRINMPSSGNLSNGNQLIGSDMPPNDNPPNGSDMPPNGNPPSGSDMPPNGNPPNDNPQNSNQEGNSYDSLSNNRKSENDEDEEFIAKYFSGQNVLNLPSLLFFIILFGHF